MPRRKVCPKCGEYNELYMNRCRSCDHSLAGAEIRQLAGAETQKADYLGTKSHEGSAVLERSKDPSVLRDVIGSKLCPHCGFDNGPYALFCKRCNKALRETEADYGHGSRLTHGASQHEDIQLTRTPSQTPKEAFLICETTPGLRWSVRPNQIAGRTGEINMLPVKDSVYISRQHARFLWDNGTWLLEHMSERSCTYVNGIEVSRGERKPICDGDRIRFGYTDFIFRIS